MKMPPFLADGYVLRRGAVPAAWLDDLRAAFDAGVKPSDEWPAPRGVHWRHSQLDLDPSIQKVCRLPEVLAVAGGVIGERFFLAQVEGREPLHGGGMQRPHRDLATRLVPGSHRPAPGEPPFDFMDESRSVQISGEAGDILVFDADLVHAASRNADGTRRRSILGSYQAESWYPAHLATAALRGIRMAISDRFAPDGT
ncbi:MAG: phytanoyl-CoA dioxygenase family protein [Burkholderiales bacterium]